MALMDYLKKETPADEAGREIQSVGKTEQGVPSSSVQHRPSWMTDDDYKEATQYYSPERIGQLYKGFDASSSSPFYQDLYKSTIHKPSVLDERKIKAARNIAGVTDALSLITQGISGFSGGYIPRIEASAQRENNAYTQRLRDIYKAENDRYSAGLYQSTLRDIESARQGYDRDRSELLGVIQASRRLKSVRGIAESKNAADMYKFGIQQEGRKATGEEQSRHNKAMEGIASRNADSAALRASKSGKSGSSTSTPRGYTDWYNPNTGYSYRLKENNIKAFVPQIFKEFEKDVFKGSSSSEKMRYKALSPSERYNYVQAHWVDSPSAVAMIEKIAESKKEGVAGSPEVEEPVNTPSDTSGKQNQGVNHTDWDQYKVSGKQAGISTIRDTSIDYNNLDAEMKKRETEKRTQSLQIVDERLKNALAKSEEMYFPTESVSIR